MYIAIFKVDNRILHLLRIDVLNIHRHLTASQFLTELGSIFQGLDGTIGVYATLKAERGVGRQAMTAGTLTNPCGMEVSRLKHNVLCGFVRTRTLATEYTGDTHRVFGIADSQVSVAELVLHTIQRLEWCTLGHGLHHNLMTFYHVGVKGM